MREPVRSVQPAAGNRGLWDSSFNPISNWTALRDCLDDQSAAPRLIINLFHIVIKAGPAVYLDFPDHYQILAFI